MMAQKESLRTFEDLKCWQACRHLRLFVSRQIIPVLPDHERYDLTRQIKNAARSMTANIAEGYGRFHYMDNSKFCSNARGSCWEVLDHLITARDEEYIEEALLATGREKVQEAVKLLNGYMNYLKRASTKNVIREDSAIYCVPSEAPTDQYPIANN